MIPTPTVPDLAGTAFAAHLLQQLPVPTFVLDAKHRVLLWNRACEQFTGILAAEVIGSDQHWRAFYTDKRPCLADLLLDGELADLTQLYARASSSTFLADTWHAENWSVMPDGRKLYIAVVAGPITDARGRVVAVVESQRDMTAQKLAEQGLRDSEQRLSAILGSAMDAIVTVDDQHRITLFNAAAQRMFRCAADLAVGQPVERFIVPSHRALFQQFLDTRQAPAAWAPQGLSAQRADGEAFPIEATFSPLELAGRRYCTVILRDVNDRRQAEQALSRLQLEKGYLEEQANSDYNFQEIVSGAAEMAAVFEQIRLVAPTDTPVLLLGETGTGKELLAGAIHNLSGRQDALLVKVNCAALPADLIESELFGHEKGAFTGATQQRKGRFELADGGTLFLDEVGELPPAAQAKLLRALQEQEFERVGGTATLKVNVRLIAATNRDLATEVTAGRFRADLYYRLNVFPLQVPALRERRSDIPLLARHFLAKYAKKFGKPVTGIAPAALARLEGYGWPGNVRELQNVIERAIILARGPLLEIDQALSFGLPDSRAASPAGTMEEVERAHILQVLEQTGGVIAGPKGAAAVLGLNPNTLRSRMQKLRIDSKSLKQAGLK